MYNKKIKILAGLIALIVVLFIGTKAQADFDLTYEKVESTLEYYNERWHYKPNNLFDNSMFFCGELGASYKKAYATLTDSDKSNYSAASDGHSNGEVCHNDNVSSGTTQDMGEIKKSMHYSKGNQITAQDFSYALTTAKAKGYGIMTTEMQRTIWGTSANKSDETDETALSKEATSYLNFFNAKEEQKKLTPDNPINLQDKTKYSSQPGNQKPSVAMDSSTGTYTVGAFKFTHIKGDYTKDGATDTSTGEYETPEEYVDKYKEKLEELMNNAKVIYDDLQESIKEEKDKDNRPIQNYNGIRYNSIEAAVNFIAVYDGTKSYLDDNKNFTNKDTSNTIQEIKNKIVNLQNAVKQLEFKKGKSDEDIKERINRIKNYADDISMIEASANSQTKFSYVRSISIIGLDSNNNERVLATNNTQDDSQIKVVDANGNKIQHKILENDNAEQTGILSEKAYNIPQSGDVFYVQFKLDEKDKDIEKIKVKVGARYLDYCDVTAYEYQGTVYNWQWVDEDTGSQCCDPDVHSPHSWPPDKDGKGGGSCPGWTTYHYYHQAVLHIRATGTKTQWLIGVPEDEFNNNAHKEWKTQELIMGGEHDGIDITMKLGGYVFLDQDGGKVNEGDNLFKNPDEGLPTADVWLYEYTGENDNGKLIDVTLTDKNGYYEFTKLDITKKYYVKFTYNGMLYENVEYDMGAWYNTENWKITSKAKEVGRQEFNNRFAEIGSYPANYKIPNKMFGNELGDYNKVFLQEEIVNIYKELSEQIVKTKGNIQQACANVANAHIGEQQIKEKIQFANDCRMTACTDREKVHINGADQGTYYVYPVFEKFTTTSYQVINVAGTTYNPIYPGQMYINYGIKARSTVDLALYKDVEKAEVTINGKTETYKYDARKGGNKFAVGISESDYLNGLRKQYMNGTSFTNTQISREVETDNYDINMRSEEVYNGVSTNNYTGVQNYALNENYTLSNEDRLAIKVTYKIGLRNQSSTPSSITEIVDYYDNNFKFNRAYTIKDGKEVNNIKASETSKFGTGTQYKGQAYKTIYLTPTSENELRLNSNGEEQYVYVEFQLLGATENDAGTLLSKYEELTLLNIAEINGYKTYTSKTANTAIGLIDIDSNPGNLNISGIDNLQNIATYVKQNNLRYEDDTNRAPALVYKRYTSRTIEGTVFEDLTGKDSNVSTAQVRQGNGQLEANEKGIKGVKVELIEIKNNQMIVRSTTTTNDQGWYGFTGFLPGNYTIRYTYGHNDETAMAKTSQYVKGVNDKSYNGQDYQSTTFGVKADGGITSAQYTTDANLISTYKTNYNNKDQQETTVPITASTVIDKYKAEYYWYTQDDKKSDARDDAFRTSQVIAYSKTEYGTEIVNHKAEVFNSYVNPQPEHIQNADTNRKLANELERRTFRYAYTPEIEIEVEYATKNIAGTKKTEEYTHKITGVDFGIVERPKSELTIDQDVKNIKVTAADGITVLLDTQTGTNNLQWINHGDINKYDKKELLNVIIDEELINGAKLEITYNLTVKNNSEKDVDSTTRAKTILNYVSNNLTFDEVDNKDSEGRALWKVVKTSDVQRESYATYVNNSNGKNYNEDKLKLLDLSTQSVILQATETNPLSSTSLAPGEQVTSTLILKKVLSTENSTDDLKYTNLSEIVEIDNTVGRYDHGATPGNQSVEVHPQEHDASGASQYADMVNDITPQDGTTIVTPPTGSRYIYYVIGITSAIILAVGIYVIKKYVIKK